jgi:hypothetical protein
MLKVLTKDMEGKELTIKIKDKIDKINNINRILIILISRHKEYKIRELLKGQLRIFKCPLLNQYFL